MFIFVVGIDGTEERGYNAFVNTMNGRSVVDVQDVDDVVFLVVVEAADTETQFIPADVAVAAEANNFSESPSSSSSSYSMPKQDPPDPALE